MSKVVDTAEIQRALDRVAREAKRGSSEARAGRFLLDRDAISGKFIAEPTRSRSQASKKKK